MKYKTCVSIAEKTPNKVKQTLKIALKKSDFVEIRFDFLKIEQIPETLELIKKDLKNQFAHYDQKQKEVNSQEMKKKELQLSN